MNKEELISFINSVDFELCTNISFTYFKKKPNQYSHDYENEPKTITFNKDVERIIEEHDRWTNNRIEDLYAGMREIREKLGQND